MFRSVAASCPVWPNKIWDRGHSQKTYWFQLQLLEFIFNCCMFCFVYVNVCYVIIESDVCTWLNVRIMDGIRRSDGRDIYYSRIVQTLSLFQIQTSFTFTAEAEPDCWVEAPTKESDIGVTTTQTAGAARRGECHSGRKIKRMEKRKKKSTTKPDWNTNNIL